MVDGRLQWRWRLTFGIVVIALLVLQFWDLPEGALGQEIFWQLRLPRLILAAFAGATLALAGLWLQTLFPYIFGRTWSAWGLFGLCTDRDYFSGVVACSLGMDAFSGDGGR